MGVLVSLGSLDGEGTRGDVTLAAVGMTPDGDCNWGDARRLKLSKFAELLVSFKSLDIQRSSNKSFHWMYNGLVINQFCNESVHLCYSCCAPLSVT